MVDVIQHPDLRVPVKMWMPGDEVEAGAMEQLRNVASHPEIALHLAVMPDCHVGYGVPIGCVAPTEGAVIPNAVGVDIGCGMHAIQTGIALDAERMGERFWHDWGADVAREVPTGFNEHKAPQSLGPLDRGLHAKPLQPLIRKKAAYQLGTLGGGNHFLEAQRDEAGEIWLMVHSGSRHTGLRIANHYNELAIDSANRRGLQVGKDLASLPLDDPIGQQYLDDMAWAEEFALASREEMGRKMVRALFRTLAALAIPFSPAEDPTVINIHHNFAALETHQGREVMVHRKGATSAQREQLGIIPGSMGTSSYIVRGLGNPESFMSCSHGAGRIMGRNAARKAISEAEFAASLTGTHSRARKEFLDEAPAAYKDIDVVMERQADLVEIIHTLRPLMTVKGEGRA